MLFMKSYLYLIMLFNISACSNIKSSDTTLSNVSQIKEYSSLDKKKVQLIETVLNLPGVLRFSQISLYRKRNKQIYILLKENEFENGVPSIVQDGQQVHVLHSLESLDTKELPFYRFRMDINGNKAYVQLFFEVTGAIAYGNLNYIESHWVPDEKFVAGVK